VVQVPVAEWSKAFACKAKYRRFESGRGLQGLLAQMEERPPEKRKVRWFDPTTSHVVRSEDEGYFYG
jgi:hypothetical protein